MSGLAGGFPEKAYWMELEARITGWLGRNFEELCDLLEMGAKRKRGHSRPSATKMGWGWEIRFAAERGGSSVVPWLDYLLPSLEWPAGSQWTPAGARDLDKVICGLRKSWRGRSVCSTGDRGREVGNLCNIFSATKLRMRLGDETWRKKGKMRICI